MESYKGSLEVESALQSKCRILSNEWFFIFLNDFLTGQW